MFDMNTTTATTATTATVTISTAAQSRAAIRRLLRAHPLSLGGSVPGDNPLETERARQVFEVLGPVMDRFGAGVMPWYTSLTGAQRRLARATAAAILAALILEARSPIDD